MTAPIARAAMLATVLAVVALLLSYPRSVVVVRNHESVAIDSCTIVVQSEFWWDQVRKLRRIPAGASDTLRFHPLSESNFIFTYWLGDVQVHSVSTEYIWDPAPGEIVTVIELWKDGPTIRWPTGSTHDRT